MSTLLYAIVEAGKAHSLMMRAKKAGCSGGTILYARGTAGNSLLCLLGLGDSHKEIMLMLVEDSMKDTIWDTLIRTPSVRGLLCAVPAYRNGTAQSTEQHTDWDMVHVICASGYSDDIIAAARKVGAGGGTIMEGRGTATQDDMAFYGSSLVPEKEVLAMFLKKEYTDNVLQAIAVLPCMQQAGSGIAFSYGVQELISLKK